MAAHKDTRRQVGNQEIGELVHGLGNLRVQADLFVLGERAVPALVSFLHGPASRFAQGRGLATEALGRIGGEAAFQDLLQALDPRRLEHWNPVLRLSEETVQDAVARQLARLGDRWASRYCLRSYASIICWERLRPL
ncbi:MAG: hypothetical protein C4293_12975 [Nitrospiraceae bacterium]